MKFTLSFLLVASMFQAFSLQASAQSNPTPTPTPITSSSDTASEWLQWSGDLLNHHHRVVKAAKLTLDNVKNLAPLWTYQTHTGVFGIPTVQGGKLYFGDIGRTNVKAMVEAKEGGYLYALDTKTGAIDSKWSAPIAIRDYLSKVGDDGKSLHGAELVRNISRVSPAIAGNKLIIGTSVNYMKYIWRLIDQQYQKIPGATIMAIDRSNGKKIWQTVVDSHFSSRITMSPVVYKNAVYVGVSSEESQIPGIVGGIYHCCNFRGSLMKLDLETGAIKWKTYTISDRAHFTNGHDASDGVRFNGVAVWGSSPPIDEKRNLIYFGTGNNYQDPADFRNCMLAAQGDLGAQKACSLKFDDIENHVDSIVAADLDSGEIKWSFKSQIYDSWNVGCGSPVSIIPPKMPGACPRPAGMDSDFGQAPMLIKNVTLPGDEPGKSHDLIVDGNKQGHYFAIDADEALKAGNTKTVKPVWATKNPGGGALGGQEWGSATNGKMIFTQTTNLEHRSLELTKAKMVDGKAPLVHGGYWSALDVATGKIVWQTPDPFSQYPVKGEHVNRLIYGRNLGRGHFAAPIGPLTLYNDILFAGSLSGHLYAMNAETGEIVWTYATTTSNKKENALGLGGSAVSAPAVVNDQLFWGVGYYLGTEDHRMISFGIKE